jgi:serine phosphatase RsbU (regulator of sigma subunit)/pSer/pThr/pTyr-binding forkhead associated (FHA) protein
MMPLWLIGEHRGEIIRRSLADGAHQVGRGSANDLVLPSQTVSRHHATLRVAGSALHVCDLGSLNGTRINGKPVHGEATAAAGDVVEFGSVLLRVADRDESIAPVWSDDDHVSSNSLFLSKDEVTDSARKVGGGDPAILRLLTEAGQLLVLPEAPERTFDRVLELVENAIPAGRVLLLLQEEKGKDPVQRAARVHGDRAISPLMLSRTMVRMVVDEGVAVLTGDAKADERFRQAESIVSQDLHSAMAVPLVHHNEVLGLLYADSSNPLATYRERDLRVLTLLGQMLGAKIANARLLGIAAEQERMRRELQTAAAIQRRLLPQELPNAPGYRIVASQSTCDAVGGDLYDLALLPDGSLQVCLGDVSGKGIAAALLMSDVLATVRALRTVIPAAGLIAQRLDKHLLQATYAEHYLTLFLGEIDPARGALTYVNCGHPPAFLLLPDGRIEELESTSPPVGLVDLPGMAFEPRSAAIPPGAALVVYSDGVSEAQRGAEQFGDHRFRAVLAEVAGRTAEEIAQRIESEIGAWVGDAPHGDDVTLVVVQRSA